DLAKAPGLAKVLPRAIDRILGNPSGDPVAVVKFIDKLTTDGRTETVNLCFAALTIKIQGNEIAGKQRDAFRELLRPKLKKLFDDEKSPLRFEATLLAAALKDADGLLSARVHFYDAKNPESMRLRSFEALVGAGVPDLVIDTTTVFRKDSKTTSVDFRGRILSTLGKVDDPRVADFVFLYYDRMEPELQPKAIELLTQRPAWAKSLFKEIAAKKISKDVVNINQ